MSQPILIVGAGPTGLAAALFLAQRGVDSRIVDAAPEPAAQSRALAVNPRTLDLLATSGVAQKIRDQGRFVRRVRFYDDWKPVAELDIDDENHFLVALPQARTEAFLREALEQRGIKPERGVGFVSLAQDGQGVVAKLVHADGAHEAARCRVLLGADGAHSMVRSALGLPFDGSAFPEAWPLIDLHLNDPLDTDSAHVCFIEGGLLFVMCLEPGLWRVFGNVPDLLDHLPPGSQPGDAEWRSSFHISHRVVAREARGRVALAGDAAHIHSPVAARGMNLGIEDAFVFADCAADFFAGRAGRLEDYGRLRHGVHKSVVRRVRALTRLARGRPALLGALRPWLTPLATRFPPASHAMLGMITGLDHEVRTH